MEKQPHYIFPQASELIRLKKFARTPEFRKTLSTSQLAGQWQSIFKGRSMDFEEVRAYQSGDDIRSIDWNISAKTGELHTQIYKEEKERPVLIVVDYSDSMHFGTKKKFKCTLAAEIASILAFSLINKGDRVGGLIFNHQIHKEVRPKMHMQGVLQLIHHLTEPIPLIPQDKESGGLFNAIKRLSRLAKPGMCVFILSDFLDFSEATKKYLIRMAEHCQVNLCMIYDPLEASLPSASFDLESEGKKFKVVGDAIQKKNHHNYFNQRVSEIQTFALKKRFTFSLVGTHEDLAKFNLKVST